MNIQRTLKTWVIHVSELIFNLLRPKVIFQEMANKFCAISSLEVQTTDWALNFLLARIGIHVSVLT